MKRCTTAVLTGCSGGKLSCHLAVSSEVARRSCSCYLRALGRGIQRIVTSHTTHPSATLRRALCCVFHDNTTTTNNNE